MVSAAIDLLVAGRFANALSDIGRAARLQLLGSILCAAGFTGVFLGFWVPDDVRFAYAIGAGLIFRFAYAIYDLPQNALMALATADAAGRDRVASTRIWFSGVATLLVALAVGPLIAGRGEDAASLYLGLAIAIAIPAIISAGLLAHILVGGGNVQPPERGETSVFRLARLPWLFWVLIGLMIVTSLATPIFSKVEPFFAAFVLQSPVWGSVIVTSMALGIISGQPIWRTLCNRFSRLATLGVAATLQLVALAVFGMLSTSHLTFLAGAAFVFGLGNGGVGMVQWAAFSEVVATSAKGREGVAYATFTAVAKISLGVGSLALGILLASFDYRNGDSEGLVTMMTGIPAVGALFCLVVCGLWAWANRQAALEL